MMSPAQAESVAQEVGRGLGGSALQRSHYTFAVPHKSHASVAHLLTLPSFWNILLPNTLKPFLSYSLRCVGRVFCDQTGTPVTSVTSTANLSPSPPALFSLHNSSPTNVYTPSCTLLKTQVKGLLPETCLVSLLSAAHDFHLLGAFLSP